MDISGQPPKEQPIVPDPFVKKPLVTAINLTILLLFIFVAERGLSAITKDNYLFEIGIGVLAMFALAGLFFVNLGLAVFRSKQRFTHLALNIAIVAAIVWFGPLTIKWHLQTQDRWFLEKGIHDYERVVEKIMQNKSKLRGGCMARIEGIASRDVIGGTNDDGSITIRFFGRGHYARACYIYNSGGDPGPWVGSDQVCLTNHWFRD